MVKSHYRADIDGLRAIAVLSVVFYHLEFKIFSGGFVGVDVFFVISGFLITRLIRSEIKDGKFTFSGFYIRRARRLLPAFLFTLVSSSCFAVFFFTPEHLKRFGGSLLHSVFAISNFYFWNESGYFNAERIFKPLLHTWSLSVEEQFYTVWPILLLLLLTKSQRWFPPLVIIIIGVLSLILSEYFIDHSAAVFYLIPFRVVEFTIGALMVWVIKYKLKRVIIHELLLLTGLVSIAYPIFSFDSDTIFPGSNALYSSIGTALVIFSGNAKYCRKILINRIFVNLGLISYSLYLIHWPIIVFYKYHIMDEVSLVETWGILAISVLSAILMYRYVESPFRKLDKMENQVSTKAFFIACSTFVYLLSLAAFDIWTSNGWEWRLNDNIRKQLQLSGHKDYVGGYNAYVWDRMRSLDKPFEPNNLKKVLIVGDSQAGDFVNMITENNYHSKVDMKTIEISVRCQPVIPYDDELYYKMLGNLKEECAYQHKLFLSSEKLLKADTIVLASAWNYYGIENIEHTIKKLNNMGLKDIYILGKKDQGYSGQMLLKNFLRLKGVEKFSAKRRPKNAWKLNNDISKLSGFHYIDIMSTICPVEDKCHVLTPDKDIIFYHITHVSPEGAKYLGQLLSTAKKIEFLNP